MAIELGEAIGLGGVVLAIAIAAAVTSAVRTSREEIAKHETATGVKWDSLIAEMHKTATAMAETATATAARMDVIDAAMSATWIEQGLANPEWAASMKTRYPFLHRYYVLHKKEVLE